MQDVEVLEGICWQETMHYDFPLIKEDERFYFEKLCILILVSTLGTPKAHVHNFGFLFQVALQCSKLEAIIIGNSQTWIGLPHIFPSNISITLQKKI